MIFRLPLTNRVSLDSTLGLVRRRIFATRSYCLRSSAWACRAIASAAATSTR
jgi:hypothetical protein